MARARIKLVQAIFVRVLVVTCILTPPLGVGFYQILVGTLSESFITSVRGALYEYARSLEQQVQSADTAETIAAYLDEILLHPDVADVHLNLTTRSITIKATLTSATVGELPDDSRLFGNNDDYFVQTTPLYTRGALGQLQAAFFEDELAKQIYGGTVLGILLLAGFTALLLLFTYTQIQRVTAVAVSLTQNAERIANGAQDTRLDVDTEIQEFGGLADALEKMRSELLNKQSALREQILLDPLTGIGNRLFFQEALIDALDAVKTRQQGFGLGLLDIDSFKDINDSFGHPAGDRLISFTAKSLQRIAKRRGGKVARMGGDEFAIIIPFKDPGECAAHCQKIREKLNRSLYLSGRQIGLGFCIGAVLVSEEIDADEVVKRADVALYAAKNNKRVPVRMFDDQLFTLENRRDCILESLKSQEYLQDNRGISLRFQPKIDIASGLPSGFEALVFWDHPELGRLSPD